MQVNKAAPFVASIDTEKIIERLIAVPIGEAITYADLSAHIGRNVQREARGVLTSARRACLNQHGVVFDIAETNVSLKRLADVDITQTWRKSLRHIRGEARRAARRLACVTDFGALPRDAQVEHNTGLSMMGALSHFTDTTRVKLVSAKVETAGQKLAVAETTVAVLNGQK